MKIKLEHPYTLDFKTGYTGINKENRKTLYLIKKGSTKITTSTAYARYKLSVKLGRYLDKNEQVDHIDNDKTNDEIDNLQILSRIENIRKSRKPPRFIAKTCPVCQSTFNVRKGLDKTKTCSRSCGGILSHMR